jgi:tRNA-specific 2-thiouridylase
VRVGFPHYVLDYSEAFRARVVEPFLSEYLAGRTPYPCSACNAELKFGRLVEQARAIGAEFVATGHYIRRAVARGSSGASEAALLRAARREKDQSYALWAVARDTLPALLFPLGDRSKDEVRSEAERLGLARVAGREESQDLCFVGAGGHAAFIERERGGDPGTRPGPIVDLSGRVLGKHRGLIHYTVGQRRGLGREAAGHGRRYVLALDARENAVHVGPEQALWARHAEVGPLNWLAADPPRAGMRIEIQVRYRGAPAWATLWPRVGEGSAGEPIEPAAGARLAFDGALRAVTPGQSAVFYDGERLLGGAPIDRAIR